MIASHAPLFLMVLAATTLACADSYGQLNQGTSRASQGNDAQVFPTRAKVIAEARRWIGTREATGQNDGPGIDAILGTVGLAGTRAPYCAAFNATVYSRAGVQGAWPRSAWSPDWLRGATWTRASGGRLPAPGDVFGIYFPSKGRIAHTGLVEQWGTSVVVTIEANTSPDAAPGTEADRNGDGIWRKRRLVRQIHSVRDWISSP
jgi:hypothetical protein